MGTPNKQHTLTTRRTHLFSSRRPIRVIMLNSAQPLNAGMLCPKAIAKMFSRRIHLSFLSLHIEFAKLLNMRFNKRHRAKLNYLLTKYIAK